MSDRAMELLCGGNENAFITEREKFEKGMETFRLSFKNFLMVEKLSGCTIGKIGFHTWYIQHNRAEIGYGIEAEEAKQKGYMKEAMARVLQYGFEDMELNRIEALLSRQNEPSRRLVEHFGFTFEGVMREHFLRKGVYEESAFYGLLRSEYERQNRK